MRHPLFRFPPVALLLLVGLSLAHSPLGAQVPDELAGSWQMDDLSPALMYPANKAGFTIIRATPGKSRWADGHFFMKWSNTPQPERGYYSLETGRVWVTTYRWVNQQEERVEYRGVVKRNKQGEVVWSGTAKTTGRTDVTWQFEAVKN